MAVTGLTREARIVSGEGVVAISGGGDSARLRSEIARLAADANGVISIGLAGALDPILKPGDAVIGDGVAGEAESWRADNSWAARLAGLLPEARVGRVSGRDWIAVDGPAKAALRERDGSLAVDMESHVVAAVAAEHGLPFAVLRFISDGADRGLPKAALVGMRADGRMDLAAVLASVARDPRQIPPLIRTGLEAEAAFRALLRSRYRLGPALGFADVQRVQLA